VLPIVKIADKIAKISRTVKLLCSRLREMGREVAHVAFSFVHTGKRIDLFRTIYFLKNQ
jgi:hypothetical protein